LSEPIFYTSVLSTRVQTEQMLRQKLLNISPSVALVIGTGPEGEDIYGKMKALFALSTPKLASQVIEGRTLTKLPAGINREDIILFLTKNKTDLMKKMSGGMNHQERSDVITQYYS